MIYEQDAQPRTVVALWKANLEDPKLRHSDPSVIILDITTSNSAILKYFGFFFCFNYLQFNLAFILVVSLTSYFMFYF